MLNLEFWYALLPRLRAVAGLSAIACLSVVLWWWWVHPIVAGKNVLAQQRMAQHALLQKRWQALLALKPPADFDMLIKKGKAFSPLDFQSDGVQLLRWRPASQGGEMLLETPWAQVPHIFARLADSQMQVPVFSLIARDNALHCLLQLEGNDGD